MTFSRVKIYLASLILLCSANTWAAEPPTFELQAAQVSIAQAQRLSPRGSAAQSLQEAASYFAQAQALVAKKKYKDAIVMANRAQAMADLASAQARLANARMEVDEKAARNEDLRRQLLINTER
jgi:acyl carrier protein phosphodiesterase